MPRILSRSAESVLAYLRTRTEPQALRPIAMATGLDAAAIIGATMDLEEAGLIEVTRSKVNQKIFYQTTFAGMAR
jgi:DNA-binding MarR family transcriptional regulator